MKLIVGLGNPGEKYKSNRHNLGFMVIDSFAKSNQLPWRYNGDLMSYLAKTSEFILAKPTIYMNKSGQSVLAVSNFYHINPKDLLVIHDDLDIDFGKIRLSINGTSGGHHGVDSTIESLGAPDFVRLRIGLGSPESMTKIKKSKIVEKYVLSDFSENEKKQLNSILQKCQEAIRSYLDDGIDAAMNRFN